MKLLKISIITPSYNQAEFIERTIQSVLNQKGNFELEYIVIDGKSTDGTLSILKKYEKRLKWISEKDQGQTDAINKGLRMATGEIVAFLNSDDTYISGTLQKVANLFQQNSQTMWTYGKCKIINENDQEILHFITKIKNFLLKHYSYFKLLCINFISQPATFWRHEAIQKIGLLDTKQHYVMDYEYWLRLGEKFTPKVINSDLANFRRYTTSKSGSGYRRQFWQEWLVAARYSLKHWYGILILIFHLASYILIVGGYTILGATSLIFRKK